MVSWKRCVTTSVPVAAVSLLLLGLSGCGTPKAPSASDLVGRWVSEDGTATLDLREHRECDAEDIPERAMLGSGTARYSSACSWSLGDGRGNERADDGMPLISVQFLEWTPTGRLILEVGGSSDDSLDVELGGPGDRAFYSFHRAD